MFNIFNRNNPKLSDIHFDESPYLYQGSPQPNKLKVWHTNKGDGLGLYFFDLKPNIPTNIKRKEEYLNYYNSQLTSSNGKVIELYIVNIIDVPAVIMIVSMPKKPTGKTMIGSITIPFRDCSYVIKCQCEERGGTGMRESIIFDRLQKHVDYDDMAFDKEFPDSPVARVRTVLSHLTKSIRLSNNLQRLPRFILLKELA